VVDLWSLASQRVTGLEDPLYSTSAEQEGKGDGKTEEKQDRDGKRVGGSGARSCTLLVIGTEGSGKSTLVQTFLNQARAGGERGSLSLHSQQNQQRQPPLPSQVDYRFIRTQPSAATAAAVSARGSVSGAAPENANERSGAGSKDQLITTHIWEIGGGMRFAPLMDLALEPQALARLLVVIVVDLSRPVTLLDQAVFWIESLRAQVKQAQRDFDTPLNQATWKNHPDANSVAPLPVPTILVANKYDLFQTRAAAIPGLAKTVATYLRGVAHKAGCSLIYTSLGGRAVELGGGASPSFNFLKTRINRHIQSLGTAGFANSVQSQINFDPSGYLFVPAGADSIQSIGDTNATAVAGSALPAINWSSGGHSESTGASKDQQGQAASQMQLPKCRAITLYRRAVLQLGGGAAAFASDIAFERERLLGESAGAADPASLNAETLLPTSIPSGEAEMLKILNTLRPEPSIDEALQAREGDLVQANLARRLRQELRGIDLENR